MGKKTLSMLVLGLLLGGGGIAAYQVAAQTSSTSASQSIVEQENSQNSTIDNEDQDEQTENQILAGGATITADEAKLAAEAQLGGSADSVKLENENGTTVYEVRIGDKEVKIDANDGSVLKVEQGDSDKNEIGENENEDAGDTEVED